jgi:hypothetical protein
MKTDCQRIVAVLPVLREAKLPPAQEQQMRAHLASCAECRNVLAGLNLVDRCLAVDAAWEPGAGGLAAHVVRAAGATARPRTRARTNRFVRMALPIAATVVLALGLTMFALHRSRQSVPLAVKATPVHPVAAKAQSASMSVAASPKQELAPFQLKAGGGPVGRPFVVRNGKVYPYEGPTSVRLIAQPSGPAALEVDVFPRERVLKPKHGRAAQRV